MPFCKACGREIGNANFCPQCGANQASVAPAPPMTSASPTEGLQENVAGLLCYVLGWVSGIIFLFIDKRPWVRFHGAQSIAVFGGLTIVRVALGVFHFAGSLIGWGLLGMVYTLLWLLGIVLWIVLMIKAFQHQTWRVPIAADIADSLVK